MDKEPTLDYSRPRKDEERTAKNFERWAITLFVAFSLALAAVLTWVVSSGFAQWQRD
ncbi:MAG: hypothetical protein H7Z14_10685 [Anaerolineae bacterium]|nr:hypothetical protein [Phycisphaerae bacterium]